MNKLSTLRTLGTCVLTATLAAALAGCGGSDDGDGNGGGGGGKGDAELVDGATFTLGLSSDPGNLDPLMGAGTSLFTVTQFAYDPLVSVDETGEIRSALATTWDVQGTTITLDLAEGITCSDGAELTATDVAASLNFVADPKNPVSYTHLTLPTNREV